MFIFLHSTSQRPLTAYDTPPSLGKCPNLTCLIMSITGWLISLQDILNAPNFQMKFPLSLIYQPALARRPQLDQLPSWYEHQTYTLLKLVTTLINMLTTSI